MNKLKYIEEAALPILIQDEVAALEASLNRRYVTYLLGQANQNVREQFRVDATRVGLQVQLRVTLMSEDGAFGYPVETITLAKDPEALVESAGAPELALLLDFQDAYWSEYFRSERETFVTLDWSEHSYQGHQIFIRGFQRNFALESAADRLFAEFGAGDHDIKPIGPEC